MPRPASAVALPSPTATDVRASYRLALSVPMRVRARVARRERIEVTQSENVSLGGTFFLSSLPYRKGMRLLLTLPYKEEASVLTEAEAEVVRIVPQPDGRMGIGVRFADPMLVNALLGGEILQKYIRTSDVLLKVMKSVGTELDLDALLAKLVAKTSEVMEAERATLFLIDRKTGELWSRVAEGQKTGQIRLPPGRGIAGHVAATGETVNIADVYADPRFDRESDARTGFRTRNMLCMPIRNERGEIKGVTQVLNKRFGGFAGDDEELLEALNGQMAVCLANAELFEEVRQMKNYSESILNSIPTGVITLGEEGQLDTINPSAAAIFGIAPGESLGQRYADVLGTFGNPAVVGLIIDAYVDRAAHRAYDLKIRRAAGDTLSVNISVFPLLDAQRQSLGMVIVAHDITQEQRLMGSLCRYVAREIAEQILAQGEVKLGGARTKVTVLFCDIRDFTTLSEQAANPEEIVSLLNRYFERMIRIVFKHGGTLDKLIGDAVMAVFGAPVAHADNALRAVRAARDMRRELRSFNAEQRAGGLAEIDIGIGLSDGEAICGHIGSEQRMEYTVIGDSVNLASRLEGLTRDKAYKILINDLAYEQVRHEIACVSLGRIKVKGKTRPVELFGVPDPED